MIQALLSLVILLVGCAPGVIAELSDAELRKKSEEIITGAELWLTSNVREKGLFVYRYDPKTDSSPSSNNELRQLMASRVLALMAAENPEFLPMHETNLKFIFENWYKSEGSIGYILFDKKSKLGGNAIALRALVASPLFEEYAQQSEALAQSILKLQSEDGSFRPWLIEPDYAFDADYLLTFYSGEAILALLEYAEKTGNQKYFNAAVKAQDFYIGEYVTRMEDNYYPAYVPWHTMSLHLLYQKTNDKKYADAMFALTDKVLELLDTTDEKGRFYNPLTPEYGAPHSSSDAVYTEGLAHAYEAALHIGDDARSTQYRYALVLAIQNLEKLQFKASEAKKFPAPERVVGGLRTSTTNIQIRTDTVQHSWDAMKAIVSALEKKEKLKL